MANKFKDITGNKYGFWTVIERNFKDTRGSYWNCKCECGNTRSVRYSALKEGKSVSCGLKSCKSKVLKLNGYTGWNRITDRTQVLINILYSMYKGAAKLDNKEFKLSKKEFTSIVLSNCYYCLDKPNRLLKDKFSDTVLLTHGVDRTDSNIGYIKQNCVTCCSTCNYMKNNSSLCDFKAHITKIHSNLSNF